MLPPAPGDRLSKDIVLLRELIAGGMGTVWVAKHEALQREVAVKLLSGRLADDDVARKRFAREAASAMEVQGAHVVQMLDYGISSDGLPFLVMELLQGEDLEARLTRGALSSREVVELVEQLAEALHVAHERNILHRDIKPGNVFLTRKGDTYAVKLVDFGFAKRLDRLTAPLTAEGMIVGTPHYMSPEQMTAGKLDGRSDLFALASVAFEAFTGHRAFPGETLREVADAVHNKPLPRPTHYKSSLPRGLDEWFARACARDRDDRFATAREMSAALEQVFAKSEAPLREERAPDARALPAKRSNAAQTSLIVVVALAAVALVVWLVLPR